MDDEELAEDMARALVSAMGTDRWESVREDLSEVVDLGHRMDEDAQLFTATAQDERDAIRTELAGTWRTRLKTVLDLHPEVRQPLEVHQRAYAAAGATINQAARDIYLTPLRTTIAVGALSGAGGAAAGVAVTTGITGGGSGTAAATGITGTKFTAMAIAFATTTAGVGGYAAYQHYTCGSFFGERSARDVIDTARRSFTDASFTFDYQALGETVLTGEADNAKPAAKLHMEVQGSTYDAVLITDQLYTRVDGSEWERQDVSTEDPRLAQGNPVKTVEYLSSSQDTAQSDCELRGTFDSELLLPDSGLPPLPFDATVAPDGHLVRLKVTVAGGDAVWTVSNWGEPRDITAPI